MAAALALFVTARALGAGDPPVASAETSSTVPAQEEIAISIAGAPTGAKVLVDGEPRPLTFSPPNTGGQHTIEISAAGYVSYHGTLDGSRGADLVVSLARADSTRRRRPASSRPPAEQAAEASSDNGAPASGETTTDVGNTDISAKETGSVVAGSRADQPEQQPSAPPDDEQAPADSKKWVGPFADEPKAKTEEPREKKWVDPFSQ